MMHVFINKKILICLLFTFQSALLSQPPSLAMMWERVTMSMTRRRSSSVQPLVAICCWVSGYITCKVICKISHAPK